MSTCSRPQGEQPRRWLGWWGGQQGWRTWPREPEGHKNRQHHTRPVSHARSHMTNGSRDDASSPEPCPRWSPVHGLPEAIRSRNKGRADGCGAPCPPDSNTQQRSLVRGCDPFVQNALGARQDTWAAVGDIGGHGVCFYDQVGGSGLTLSVGVQWVLRMSLNLRHRATEMTRSHSQTKTP